MQTNNMSEKMSTNASNVCGICNENVSKYCCPRCEVFYCSLDCYKSENHLECSENFYRDCVNEELASHNVDDESKRKMIEILQKMQREGTDDPDNIEEVLGNLDDNEVDSDDENEIDLHERIKDLNLDDPDALWSALTADEKNEFEALLNQGDVGSLIPQWEPWWMYSKEVKLVQDVDEENNDVEENALKKCPQLIKVPKFSSLTLVKPSQSTRNNIANVLASYAFAMRYFNGEVDPMEGVTYMLTICGNLDSNTNFEDLATAVEAVAQKCLQTDLIQTDTMCLEVMKRDTFLILQGPSEANKLHYCRAALSHIHRILSDTKSAGKTLNKGAKDINTSEFAKKFPEHTTEHLPKIDVSKVKKCVKKVEFYLSFIESHGMEFE